MLLNIQHFTHALADPGENIRYNNFKKRKFPLKYRNVKFLNTIYFFYLKVKHVGCEYNFNRKPATSNVRL